jgi:hypothetical protein
VDLLPDARQESMRAFLSPGIASWVGD